MLSSTNYLYVIADSVRKLDYYAPFHQLSVYNSR